jgi:hypothetical protein
MLALFLALAGWLAPAQAGTPPGAAPAAQAAEALEAELVALAREFNAARASYEKRLDELRKQGQARPEATLEHPSVAYWPRVEALAARGSAGARLWMALQFPNAHPALSAAERDESWGAHVRAAVEAGAGTALAREIARSFTALYLDAPGTMLDEALERFVARTSQRECAADALYRASIARRRGTQEPASPRAAEFGKRLAADYADTAAARLARGEPEIGLAIGKQAPDFTAQDADGVSFKLSDYRGKVVVLDFWGFW